jgi:hypothetical protein
VEVFESTAQVLPARYQAARVAVDSHGEVYVAGYTSGEFDGIKPIGEHDNVVISKLDLKGTKLWTRFVMNHAGRRPPQCGLTSRRAFAPYMRRRPSLPRNNCQTA